jgi:uncharacterized membrane protein
MSSKAAITVLREREEVERLWHEPAYRSEHIAATEAAVRFLDAPGERGTEIHVELEESARGGKLGAAVKSLAGGATPTAKVKDDLRRFKQMVETGVIARSDGVPEGELAERKFKQRPAQPLPQDELQKAGV